jgi:hypothetical protein
MDSANLIQKQLELIGESAVITDGEWSSTPFRAVISHLWRKKSSAFEVLPSEIGINDAEYYLYIGPHMHDITVLSGDAFLEASYRRYKFIRKDAVKQGDDVIYYTGILRRLTQTDYGT